MTNCLRGENNNSSKIEHIILNSIYLYVYLYDEVCDK